MVLLDATVAIFKTPDNWGEIAWAYLEALEDVPSDLAAKALKHVRKNRKFFPKPADIREPILEDLKRRKAMVSKINTLEMGLNHFEGKS